MTFEQPPLTHGMEVPRTIQFVVYVQTWLRDNALVDVAAWERIQ